MMKFLTQSLVPVVLIVLFAIGALCANAYFTIYKGEITILVSEEEEGEEEIDAEEESGEMLEKESGTEDEEAVNVSEE